MAKPVIEVCPYELFSPSGFNARESSRRRGWLLRCQFSTDLVGYSDFHPLAIKDDPERLLKDALSGNPGLQFQQSLSLAHLDANARQANKSLLDGLTAPLSHALVRDVLLLKETHLKNFYDQGFRILKLKLGRDLKAEQEALSQLRTAIANLGLRLRLDFNASNSLATWSEWEMWLKTHLQDSIDFVEDPVPWDSELWSSSKLPLALDLEWHQAQDAKKDFLNRIIWKPALGLGFDEKDSSRCVVTHIMDHPLGQLGAVYWALKNNIHSIGGYLNGEQKDSLGFFEEMKSDGPQLKFPSGTGWGFNERLSALKWQSL